MAFGRFGYVGTANLERMLWGTGKSPQSSYTIYHHPPKLIAPSAEIDQLTHMPNLFDYNIRRPEIHSADDGNVQRRAS